MSALVIIIILPPLFVRMVGELFILLVTCLCTLAAQCQEPAQEEHMKFMVFFLFAVVQR